MTDNLNTKRPELLLVSLLFYFIPWGLAYPVFRVNCDVFEDYYSVREHASACHKNGSFMAAFLIPPCALLIPLLCCTNRGAMVCTATYLVVMGFIASIALPCANIDVKLPLLNSWGAIVVVCLAISVTALEKSKYSLCADSQPDMNESELGECVIEIEKDDKDTKKPNDSTEGITESPNGAEKNGDGSAAA